MNITINDQPLGKADIKNLRAALVHFFRTTSDLLQTSNNEVFFHHRDCTVQVLDLLDGRVGITKTPYLGAYAAVVRQRELTQCNEVQIVVDDYLLPVRHAVVARMALSSRLPKALMNDNIRRLRQLLVPGYTS